LTRTGRQVEERRLESVRSSYRTVSNWQGTTSREKLEKMTSLMKKVKSCRDCQALSFHVEKTKEKGTRQEKDVPEIGSSAGKHEGSCS
jgi:hypothetical protein